MQAAASSWKRFFDQSREIGMINTIRAAANLLRTIDEPRNSNIAHGIEILRRTQLDKTRDAPIDDPRLRELFEERYDPPIDVVALLAKPAGTLGAELARFFRQNDIVPLNEMIATSTSSPAEYFLRRAYKLHDILHVVLGCHADVLGEVEIVSFSYGQATLEIDGNERAPAIALGVLLLHTAIKNPSALQDLLRRAVRWIPMGRSCSTHVAFRFEDCWDWPVDDVRRAYLGKEWARC